MSIFIQKSLKIKCSISTMSTVNVNLKNLLLYVPNRYYYFLAIDSYVLLIFIPMQAV